MAAPTTSGDCRTIAWRSSSSDAGTSSPSSSARRLAELIDQLERVRHAAAAGERAGAQFDDLLVEGLLAQQGLQPPPRVLGVAVREPELGELDDRVATKGGEARAHLDGERSVGERGEWCLVPQRFDVFELGPPSVGLRARQHQQRPGEVDVVGLQSSGGSRRGRPR